LKRWKPWNNRETQLHTIVYNTGTALRILKITILGTNIAIFAVGHVFVLLAPSLEMRILIKVTCTKICTCQQLWHLEFHGPQFQCFLNQTLPMLTAWNWSTVTGVTGRFGTPVP
jgi:hypothetical protein